jgi:hypothetical protein
MFNTNPNAAAKVSPKIFQNIREHSCFDEQHPGYENKVLLGKKSAGVSNCLTAMEARLETRLVLSPSS